jgi:hypothetical protein
VVKVPEGPYPLTSYWVTSGEVGVTRIVSNTPATPPDPFMRSGWHLRSRTEPMRWWFLFEQKAFAGITVTSVFVPLWAVVVAFATAASLLWRHARRRPPGACPACGYDLRGVPATVCPECGTGSGQGTSKGEAPSPHDTSQILI